MALTQSIEKKSETVSRILKAAMTVFSEAGFGSTRVDEIARRAGVNKATIYYHIGNKETLYAEVIHGVIGKIADAMAVGMQDSQSPEEKIKTYVRNIIHAIADNPQVPPIMMREIASQGQNFPDVVAQDVIRIVGIVADILDEGVKKNVFVETNPFILHMMVIGTVMFYQASSPVRVKLSRIPKHMKYLNALKNRDISGYIEDLVLRAIKR